MDQGDRRRINSNLVALTQDLQVDETFMAHLQSTNILTVSMVEELTVIKERTKRNSHFLQLIPRRGPKAFDSFVKVLMLTGQESLAEILDATNAQIYAPQNPPQRPKIIQPKVPKPHDFTPEKGQDSGEAFIQVRDNITNIVEKDPYIQQLIADKDNVYKMSSSPRGKCVIISNENFTNMNERDGSQYDVVNFCELFKALHFEVATFSNLGAQEIKDLLNEQRQTLNNCDCFALAIFSHGSDGNIYGIDTIEVSIQEEMVKQFDSNNCPSMAGKPKLFFIQACQGKAVTLGVVPQADGAEEVGDAAAEELPEKTSQLQMNDELDSAPEFNTTHEQADMLMAYSTVAGYKSWRNPELGTWFIRDVVRVFMEDAHQEHLADMLVKVTKEVDRRSVTGNLKYKQLTETRTRLRKKLYFFPGYIENE